MDKQTYICPRCSMNCRTKTALDTHAKAKHNEEIQEDNTMANEEILEREIQKALRIKDIESENARLKNKVLAAVELESQISSLRVESQKLKEKLKENDAAIQDTKARLENHPELVERLIGCPECLPGLAKKIMAKIHSADPEKFKELVCDSTGCHMVLVNAELTETKTGSGFHLGRSH